MRYADANVIKIKHAVLEEVARLAFAGELEERKDEIPFSSAAVFTRKERLSVSASGWRKEKLREWKTTEM